MFGNGEENPIESNQSINDADATDKPKPNQDFTASDNHPNETRNESYRSTRIAPKTNRWIDGWMDSFIHSSILASSMAHRQQSPPFRGTHGRSLGPAKTDHGAYPSFTRPPDTPRNDVTVIGKLRRASLSNRTGDHTTCLTPAGGLVRTKRKGRIVFFWGSIDCSSLASCHSYV